MSSSANHLSRNASNKENSTSEVPSTFKRRLVNTGRWFLPRRYIMAFMLLTLLLIQSWKNLNIIFTLARIIIIDRGSTSEYSAIGDWTLKELDAYKTGSSVAAVFAQLPGALLIFIFSSHKYLLICVSVSSFLHMLTPVALNHHSISLLFVLMGQCVITAPINTAVIATWKDWASPGERTKLVLFSLYGLFVGAAGATFYPLLFPLVSTSESYYLAGLAGIIWTLFWYNITSDTPQNDPLISEEELINLENNIPVDFLQKVKVKDIPWKSIITSKQVLILCLIFFKLSCSMQTLMIGGTLLSFHVGAEYTPLFFFVPFLVAFASIIPCVAVLADFLIKKFSGRSLLIRKIFLSGGFSLQCFFMFGILAPSDSTKTIFFMISYYIFAMSLPGFTTLALDLSPRYVSIICGFLFTIFTLGIIIFSYFVEATVSILHLDSITWLFLFDGIFSLLTAVIFAIWGDNEEQLWSLRIAASSRTNDYHSYPKPEDEDELKLVQESL